MAPDIIRKKNKKKKTFPSVPHCFKFSTNETLNCHESSQVNLNLEISQCLCIMTTDLTMTVNKIWSVGTKCKAHHQVAFPTKQLQHVLPHVVWEKCFSVSPVHESTVIVEKKKEIKINIYTSPYTSKKVQRASISPSLSRMCNNCAKSFGPSSNEEQTSTQTFH